MNLLTLTKSPAGYRATVENDGTVFIVEEGPAGYSVTGDISFDTARAVFSAMDEIKRLDVSPEEGKKDEQ